METVRLGIIGVGNMGSGHANNIVAGKCPEITLTAVADINPVRLDRRRDDGQRSGGRRSGSRSAL